MHDFFKNIPDIDTYAPDTSKNTNYITIKKETTALVSNLENMVNNFGVSYPKLINEIDADNKANILHNTLILALSFIRYYATSHSVWVDGRNEIAVERCKIINDIDIVTEMADNLNIPTDLANTNNLYTETDPRTLFLKMFADISNTNMHRTLMQTATGFFIYVICKENPAIEEYLEKTYYPEYWRLPLI